MNKHHFFKSFCAIFTIFMLIANSLPVNADDNPYNDSDYETVVVVGVTDSGTFGDNLEWKLYSNGKFEITTTKPGTGIIPDFLEQADIPWRDYQNEIKSVNISDGVTRIGGASFSYCENLSSVIISDGVSEIGESAFFRCQSLQNITIPQSVRSIGRYCFWKCTNLSDIVFMNPECAIYDDPTTICNDTSFSDTFFNGTIIVKDTNTDNSVSRYAQKNGYETKMISEVYSGQCGDNAFWNFDKETGVLTISGSGDMWDYDLDKNEVPWQHLRYSNAELKDIIIKDGITSVGDNAFCFMVPSNRADIVVPASVKRIGTGAFLLYGEWDITILNPECDIADSEYTISSGGNGTGSYFLGIMCGYKNSTAQAYAEKYRIAFLTLESPSTTATTTTTTEPITTTTTTEPTTTTTEIRRKFAHTADAWSFGNSDKNFIDVSTNRYYLLPEHAEKLADILAWKEEYRLEKFMNSVEYTKGACYGMSVLSMLNYCNVINPSDIQEDANFISDIVLTDNVKSIINYHHFLQVSEPIFNQLKEFHYYNNNRERVKQLLDKIRQNPTVIFLSNNYKKPDGSEYHFRHVVLGYELSSGFYEYNGKAYDKKISIYDPKTNIYSEDRNMYLNSSTGNWIIPAYPISYDSSSTDPDKTAVIAGAINNTDILAENSLFADNTAVPTQKLYRPDMLVSTSSDGNIERINQNGFLFSDGEDEDDIVEGFSFASGDDDNNLKSYYMRYTDASYQFRFNDGYNYARLDMRYEHTLTDIEVDYLNKAVFSPESVKIKAMKSDYKIHNIHDIQMTENEFYRLDIQGKNASELELIYENGYWVLSSDVPLGMLQITGTNSYGTSERLLSTSAGKIRIFTESESSVGIMTDDDNDNIFETYLTYDITKGDVNGDGNIDATDASEVLAEYARISTGNNISFSDEQSEAADIDCDGTINSTDASSILSFFSYISTGGAEINMIKWILNS